jgi:transcriptional regulator with XRE-family HTH domain
MAMVKDATTATSEQRVGELIRELRTQQELSLRTLAARAGFSPSFLSQVENGQASPSISSLERIAHSLGITIGDFFRATAGSAVVVRTDERAALTSSWSHARIEALGPTGPGHVFEPLMIILEPGGQSGGRPYARGGDEFAFVHAGELVLTLGERVYRLTGGDAATFPAETPHRWENVGREPALIVAISARAR